MELFWRRRLEYGEKSMEKEITVRLGLEAIIQIWTTLLCLGSLWRIVTIIKPISFGCFIDFRKTFDTMPKTNLWNWSEELNVPFELRVVAIRLYENIITKVRNIKG